MLVTGGGGYGERVWDALLPCASITSRIEVEGLASVSHVSQHSAVELWPTRGETFEEDVGAVRGNDAPSAIAVGGRVWAIIRRSSPSSFILW